MLRIFTDGVRQDLHYLRRSIVRSPGFYAIAILTLALGIAAAATLLNVVNALLLRPLPFHESRRLVSVVATTPERARDSTSFPDVRDWRQQSRTLSDLAAYRTDAVPLHITGDGTPEPIRVLRASHGLFGVLEVTPAIGRTFTEDEQHRAVPVALLSDALWQRRYQRNPAILGTTILVNETPHTVVGVLPPPFQFPPYYQPDLVVPIAERPSRSSGYLFAVARLRPGIDLAAAQQELEVIARQLQAAYPDSNRGRGIRVLGLQDEAVAGVRTPLLLLSGAALFMLLIGCANVGGLMLAKGIERQHELAVRISLGAAPPRLCRQLLTESLALALAGAAAGAALAYWGTAFLVTSLAQRFRLPEIAFDWSLIAFALVLALVSGVLCGLAPALMAWRSDVNDTLKKDGRKQAGSATQQRLRHALVVTETTLTVMLLIGAALLVNSFIRFQRIDVGLDAQRALSADLMLSKRNAEPGRREAFVRRLLEAVSAVPAVRAVAVHVDPPFLGGGRRETFNVEGHADPAPDRGHTAAFDIVSGSGFFQAMDLPVVRGRAFGDRDGAGSPPVAIVNEAMARTFWPREDAIGKRIRFFYDPNRERWLSIVGVVRDVRYRGRLMDPTPQVFVPGQQGFYKAQDQFVSMVVRTAGDPAALTRPVQAAIWSVDKDLPIWNVQPLDRALWEAAAVPRVSMRLTAIFAAIALLLAIAGIYGLTAYTVVRRAHEMGIRMALGASSGQILALVLRQTTASSAVGVGLGIIGALSLSRVLAGSLVGITATDAPTFAAAATLFVGVTFVAAYVPARRAGAIEAAIALRAE